MADDELKALLREVIAGGRGAPVESEKAVAAAKKEFDNDPLIKNARAAKPDKDLQQKQVDAAVHELRVAWGLDK